MRTGRTSDVLNGMAVLRWVHVTAGSVDVFAE